MTLVYDLFGAMENSIERSKRFVLRSMLPLVRLERKISII